MKVTIPEAKTALIEAREQGKREERERLGAQAMSCKKAAAYLSTREKEVAHAKWLKRGYERACNDIIEAIQKD